jgi:hypothetical protein
MVISDIHSFVTSVAAVLTTVTESGRILLLSLHRSDQSYPTAQRFSVAADSPQSWSALKSAAALFPMRAQLLSLTAL